MVLMYGCVFINCRNGHTIKQVELKDTFNFPVIDTSFTLFSKEEITFYYTNFFQYYHESVFNKEYLYDNKIIQSYRVMIQRPFDSDFLINMSLQDDSTFLVIKITYDIYNFDLMEDTSNLVSKFKLIDRDSIIYNSKTWNSIDKIINNYGFWTQNILILEPKSFDGTGIIMEGVRKNGYHYLIRSYIDTSQFNIMLQKIFKTINVDL